MNYSLLETKTSIEPPSAASMRLWLMLTTLIAVALGLNLVYSVRLTNEHGALNYSAWTDFLEYAYNHFVLTMTMLGTAFFAVTWILFRTIHRDGRRIKLMIVMLPAPLLIFWLWVKAFIWHVCLEYVR